MGIRTAGISVFVSALLLGCNGSDDTTGTGGAAGGQSGGAAGTASGGTGGATGGAAGNGAGGAAGAAGGSCVTGQSDKVTFTWSCSETTNGCTGNASEQIEIAADPSACGMNGAGCLVENVSNSSATLDLTLCSYSGPGSYTAGAVGTALAFFVNKGTCPGGSPADFQPDTTGGACEVQVLTDCASGGVHHLTGTFTCPKLEYAATTCSITAGTFDLSNCAF